MRLFLRQLGALVRLSFLDLYRRKDLVTVGALALALLVPLAALRPFGVAGADRYVGAVAMGLIWLFSLVIAIALGARQFPPEFESRTIYPLLARPVGRSTVLLGKYLGAFLAAVSATALFYVLFAVYRGSTGSGWFPSVLWQGFVLHVCALAVAVALSMTLSLAVTMSANLAFSAIAVFGMFIWGGRLPELAVNSPLPAKIALDVVYAIAPHFEFFDLRQRIVHSWDCVGVGVMLVVVAYAVLCSAALLSIAALLLRKRKV